MMNQSGLATSIDFLSNRKFLNFLLDKKSTYRSEVQRNDSHDIDKANAFEEEGVAHKQ